MTPEEITAVLNQRFGETACQYVPPDAWKVDINDGDKARQLLVILEGSWVKLLTPIMPIAQAEPFLQQMMEANFTQTQETRYALHQNVVWGMFQYDLGALTRSPFESALEGLLTLNRDGVKTLFDRKLESQLIEIIQVSKRQGRSLEATLQTLDRFYSEGLLGIAIDESPAGDAADRYRQSALAAWQRQLERLWPTVEAEPPTSP